MNADRSQPLPGNSVAPAIGDLLAAIFVLGLAGVCLWLLATSVSRGTPEGPGTTQSTDARARPADLSEPRLDPPMLIVTVSEARGEEVRLALAQEASLRVALSEQPRIARVVAATTVAEATALAEAINDQANIPGAAPTFAVVVR